MQVFKSVKGSATVDAALIIPLVFIIVAGIISVALTYYGRIYDQSQKELQKIYPEDIVRTRRLLGTDEGTGNE